MVRTQNIVTAALMYAGCLSCGLERRGRRCTDCDMLPYSPRVLTDASKSFVAVHTQVFVANPNKTQSIIDILAGNKDKLLRYLADFHSDKSAVLGRLRYSQPSPDRC